MQAPAPRRVIFRRRLDLCRAHRGEARTTIHPFGRPAKSVHSTRLANGKKIGEGRVDKTTPFKYSLFEGQDIGEDTGSPIDFSYAPPFKFTGKLGKVTVELKPEGGTGGRALQ
jgi:hypothetical protein